MLSPANAFLLGAMLGLIAISIVVIPYCGLLLIWLTAKYNQIFTMVEEGTSKAVMINKEFRRFILTYSNAKFYKDLGEKGRKKFEEYREKEGLDWEVDDYDIYFDMSQDLIDEANKKVVVEKNRNNDTTENKKWRLRNLIKFLGTSEFITRYTKGLHWIGLPFIARINRDRFRWLSIEEIADKETGESTKKLTMRDEVLDYIQHKIDTYPLTAKSAETLLMMPLDGLIVVTARTENPRKTWFGLEKWMEVMESRLGSRVRQVLAIREYKEIVRGRLDKDEQSKSKDSKKKVQYGDNLLSDENLGGILTFLRKELGLYVISVEILRVDPSKELHDMFVKAATLVYVAKEQAAAHEIEGAGLGARDRIHFEEAGKTKDGINVLMARELAKINAVSFGGDKEGRFSQVVLVGDETKKDSGAKNIENATTSENSVKEVIKRVTKEEVK